MLNGINTNDVSVDNEPIANKKHKLNQRTKLNQRNDKHEKSANYSNWNCAILYEHIEFINW